MSSMDNPPQQTSISDDQIDRREQPYNGRETGPITRVQLSTDNITTLHGIVYDIDLHLLRPDGPMPGANTSPKQFFRKTLGPILDRHPALAGAEVRDTGRNVHVITWLDVPCVFGTDGERRRWAGIVQVVQAALPIDPDQPGITALTRPIGSINSKTGRRVELLRPGKPVPVAEVLRLYDQMARCPFRTVMGILLGGDRVSPCPVCRVEETSLSALDHVGRCCGSCGKVKLDQVYDLFLIPRAATGKEATDVKI
jgi:hypothetical protein